MLVPADVLGYVFRSKAVKASGRSDGLAERSVIVAKSAVATPWRPSFVRQA
jgi:hypothetical protein